MRRYGSRRRATGSPTSRDNWGGVRVPRHASDDKRISATRMVRAADGTGLVVLPAGPGPLHAGKIALDWEFPCPVHRRTGPRGAQRTVAKTRRRPSITSCHASRYARCGAWRNDELCD